MCNFFLRFQNTSHFVSNEHKHCPANPHSYSLLKRGKNDASLKPKIFLLLPSLVVSMLPAKSYILDDRNNNKSINAVKNVYSPPTSSSIVEAPTLESHAAIP